MIILRQNLYSKLSDDEVNKIFLEHCDDEDLIKLTTIKDRRHIVMNDILGKKSGSRDNEMEKDEIPEDIRSKHTRRQEEDNYRKELDKSIKGHKLGSSMVSTIASAGTIGLVPALVTKKESSLLAAPIAGAIGYGSNKLVRKLKNSDQKEQQNKEKMISEFKSKSNNTKGNSERDQLMRDIRAGKSKEMKKLTGSFIYNN